MGNKFGENSFLKRSSFFVILHLRLIAFSHLFPGFPIQASLEKARSNAYRTVVFSHWTWLPPLRKQLAKVRAEFFNAGNQVVIRLMTPLDMAYNESYAKAFPFDKIIPDMLDPEMIEDTAKSVNAARKDWAQVNLIINNRAGASQGKGNGPPEAARSSGNQGNLSGKGFHLFPSFFSRLK
jgi:hypothetical protein